MTDHVGTSQTVSRNLSPRLYELPRLGIHLQVPAKIQTLIAIPGGIETLAQVTVVFSQHSTTKQQLSARQLLVLADRSLGDVPVFWGTRRIDRDLGLNSDVSFPPLLFYLGVEGGGG